MRENRLTRRRASPPRSGRAPAVLRSARTRSRILESAQKLFARTGYDATGVAGICVDAGVSKGSFYHHFKSKQALFIVLLENWLRDVEHDLDEALAKAPSIAEGLLGMAAATREVFRSADGGLPIFLEFWAQARKDPAVWKRTIAPFRLYRDIFAQVIQRGITDGSLRAVDPALAAQTLVSLAVGMLLQGVLDPKAAAWDQVTLGAVRLLIEGIGGSAT